MGDKKLRAMRQWSKKTVRSICLLVVMAVTISLFQMVVLPHAIQRLILSRLAEIGLPEATLDVRSCSWRSAELIDVELGNQPCAGIGAMTVEYSLTSLWRGRVSKVFVTGGRLALRIRDGKVEFGELAQITFRGGEQKERAPFDTIELRASVLSIEWPQKHICIPCEGTIRDNGAGWIVHDLRLNFQNTPLRLKATLYTRGETLAFSLDKQDIDLRTLVASLPVEVVSIPPRLAGTMSLDLRGEISTTGSGGWLKGSLSDTWFKTAIGDFPLDAEGVAGEFDIQLENLSELESIMGTLRADVVELAEVQASDVKLDLKNLSDALVVSGEARGKKWHLQSFTATFPDMWRSGGTRRNRADVTWAFEGIVPEPIAQTLDTYGINISGLDTINADGIFSASLSKKPDLDLDRIRMTLSRGTVSFRRSGVVLQGISGIIEFKGNYSRDEARFQLLSDTTLDIENARLGGVTVGQTRVDFKAIDDRDIVKVVFHENGASAYLNLEAGTESLNVRTTKNTHLTELHGIRLSLDAAFSPKLKQASGLLSVDRLRYYPGYHGFSLDLREAGLNIASKPGDDGGTVLEGTMNLVAAALLNDTSDVLFATEVQEIEPITGTFDPAQRSGAFRSDYIDDSGATLHLQGALDLSQKQPSTSITAVCEGLHLETEHPVVRMLAASTGIVFSGDLSWEADLRWRQGHFAPRIKGFFTNASVSSEIHKAKAEGINGSIVLTHLSPFGTPGGQTLTIQRLTLGQAEFADGYITFRLDTDPAAVFIERTEWEWMKGRLYTQAVRIDPNRPRVDFKLYAERLALRELLDMAFGEGATGRGELYGMIPVSISLSQFADLRLGEGFLHCTSREGWWKLADKTPERPAWQAIEKQLKRVSEGGRQATSSELLLQALLDFEFDRFKIDFLTEQTGLTARIVTKGRSRNKLAPHEFERITINIPHFDENLRQMLAIKSAIDVNLNRATKEVRQ